jgi:hypothetical protein
MAKLIIPEGFVLVEAKPRGKHKRTFGETIYAEMGEVGEGFYLTKDNGESFSGLHCSGTAVKQAKATLAAVGVTATFTEMYNALEKTVQGFFTATAFTPEYVEAREAWMEAQAE